MSSRTLHLLDQHRAQLLTCQRCPNMIGPVIAGPAVVSKILLIGQAPGDKEGRFAKPFSWTAGKTLFTWFKQIGLDETQFRERVYIAAVCRCFPGKQAQGGDRVPNITEIQQCASWLAAEMHLLQAQLIIPVGKLAIQQLLACDKLTEVIGQTHPGQYHGFPVDIIPLPHPSGASTWHRKEPGRRLLQQALAQLEQHPCWQASILRDLS